MEKYQKSWSLHVFSSAHAVKSYSIEQLIRLGIVGIWIGLEGNNSQYGKLHHIDTHKLVYELQSHGIAVIGSSLIGLETHTPKNIDDVIDWGGSVTIRSFISLCYIFLKPAHLFTKNI